MVFSRNPGSLAKQTKQVARALCINPLVSVAAKLINQVVLASHRCACEAISDRLSGNPWPCYVKVRAAMLQGCTPMIGKPFLFFQGRQDATTWLQVYCMLAAAARICPRHWWHVFAKQNVSISPYGLSLDLVGLHALQRGVCAYILASSMAYPCTYLGCRKKRHTPSTPLHVLVRNDIFHIWL